MMANVFLWKKLLEWSKPNDIKNKIGLQRSLQKTGAKRVGQNQRIFNSHIKQACTTLLQTTHALKAARNLKVGIVTAQVSGITDISMMCLTIK